MDAVIADATLVALEDEAGVEGDRDNEEADQEDLAQEDRASEEGESAHGLLPILTRGRLPDGSAFKDVVGASQQEEPAPAGPPVGTTGAVAQRWLRKGCPHSESGAAFYD